MPAISYKDELHKDLRISDREAVYYLQQACNSGRESFRQALENVFEARLTPITDAEMEMELKRMTRLLIVNTVTSVLSVALFIAGGYAIGKGYTISAVVLFALSWSFKPEWRER